MDSLAPPRFASTRWSVVAAADAGDPRAADALQELCGAYWRPLYAFLRRRGHAPHDAEDLVQGFLADLLGRNDFAAADRSRGRFRTFLLAALKNYASKRREHDQAVKRGGAAAKFTLDFAAAERGYGREPADGRTAEQVFERQWALATLRRTLDELETSQRDAGRGPWFDELKGLLTGGGAAPYVEIAGRLGSTPGAVKAAASRLRREYRERLERALADGLEDADAVADERQRLFAALA